MEEKHYAECQVGIISNISTFRQFQACEIGSKGADELEPGYFNGNEHVYMR